MIKLLHFLKKYLLLALCLFTSNTIDAQVDLVNETSESTSNRTINIPTEIGEPGILTFSHKRQTAGLGNIEIKEILNDGTINTLGKVSPGTSYQTQSYNLNRNAKQITFTLSGTLKKYTKDIKVTLAYYIEQGSQLSEFSVGTPQQEQNLIINYSGLTNKLSVSSDNELFSVTAKEESMQGIGHGRWNITVRYNPTTEGSHSANIKITDGNTELSIPVTGSYTIAHVEGLTSGITNCSQIPISWDSLGENATYHITVLDANNTEIAHIENIPDTNYIISNLAPNTNYTIQVSAVIDGKQTEASTTTANTQNIPISTDIKTESVDSYNFTASWEVIEGANAYLIETYTSDGTLIKSQEFETTSGTITELSPYTNYTYTVKGIVKANGNLFIGKASQTQTLKTHIGIAEILPNTNSDIYPDGFMAKWNAVNGAIKYTLNIYEIGVSEPIKTSEIEVGKDFYQIYTNGLIKDRTYNYTVTAYEENGFTTVATSPNITVENIDIYIMNENTEYNKSTVFTLTINIPIENGEPELLTYEHSKSWGGIQNVKVAEILKDGTENYLGSPEQSTDWQTANFQLSRNAVKLKFYTTTGATMNKYIRNIKITLAHYISNDNAPQVFTTNSSEPDIIEQTVNINYSNVTKLIDVELISDDKSFSMEINEETKLKSAYGILPVFIKYNPVSSGKHSATLRATDGNDTINIPLTGYRLDINNLQSNKTSYTTIPLSWDVIDLSDIIYSITASNEEEGIVVQQDSIVNSQYIITGLKPGTEYKVEVSAQIDEIKSKAETLTIKTMALASPEITTVENITTSSFEIRWSAVEGVDSYRGIIYNEDGSIKESFNVKNGMTENVELKHLVESGLPNTTYYYTLESVVEDPVSKDTLYSAPLLSTTFNTETLYAPTTIIANNITNNSFEARWSGVDFAYKYFIQLYIEKLNEDNIMSFIPFGDPIEIYASSENTMYSETIRNLEANTQYYFTVSVNDKAGNEAISDKESFTTDEITTKIENFGSIETSIYATNGEILVNTTKDSIIYIFTLDGKLTNTIKAQNGLNHIPTTLQSAIVRVGQKQIKLIIR